MNNFLHFIALALPLGQTILQSIELFTAHGPIDGAELAAIVTPTIELVASTFHAGTIPVDLINEVCAVVATTINAFFQKKTIAAIVTAPVANPSLVA